MNREQYLAQRQLLVNEAQALINDGKVDEANAKQEEIKTLDNNFEAAAKAQADLNALNNVRPNTNTMEALGGDNEDIYNSIDYRKAFMNHVIKGSEIPSEFRNANANTKTTDVGEMIPTTIMERIIEKLESTGMILPLITRTSLKGGVEIPTSNVKPVATWVAEGAGSAKQKKTTASISFGYHKLRCAISMSLEAEVMALEVFERVFVANVVEAMVKAVEQSVINGTGTGQPKGILKETVADGQNVEIPAAQDVKYATLVEAEAALPLAYESDAVWFMTKKTFMKFVGMVDDQKQPIARVNYGINGRPERTLLGRQVILNDYMTSLGATITEDTVVAFLFNPKDFVLNTNLNMTIKKYEDNDTDDMITKAIMLVDGKVIDKNSLVTITKKFA